MESTPVNSGDTQPWRPMVESMRERISSVYYLHESDEARKIAQGVFNSLRADFDTLSDDDRALVTDELTRLGTQLDLAGVVHA